MKNKTLVRFGTFATTATLALVVAVPVSAQNVNANVTATVAPVAELKAEVKAQRKAIGQEDAKRSEKGVKEIDRRISALQKLVTQVTAMKRLSENDKASINASLNAQISALQSLKAKIAANADADILKADLTSITDSYRIFALVVPQGQIIAAADRLVTIADAVATAGAKLELQISEAEKAGKDVAALKVILAEYAAKVAEARTAAQTAVNSVVSLAPDQGDKVKMQANLKALKDARAQLVIAEKALRVARQDADKIMKAWKTLKVSATASTTTATQ